MRRAGKYPRDRHRVGFGWIVEDGNDLFMRRRLLTSLLAVLAAIWMAVPLWAALTSERALGHSSLTASTLLATRARAMSPVTEAATLAVTGGLLLALASAVRRNT